MEFSEA